MEDVVLKVDLDKSTALYVSPIARRTYQEHVQDADLGGAGGYFILLSRNGGPKPLEVLAKASSLEAAEGLLSLVC